MGQLCLGFRGSRLTMEAWDRKRNLVRRVSSIKRESAARRELGIERFRRKEGPLFLLDLVAAGGASGWFSGRFGNFLRRQFLSYLRARERRVALNGLAIYVPAGREQAAALRLLCLIPLPQPSGSLIRPMIRDPRLEPCRRLLPDDGAGDAPWLDLLSLPGVEVSKPGGALRVHGLEFAGVSGKDLLFGRGERVPARGYFPGITLRSDPPRGPAGVTIARVSPVHRNASGLLPAHHRSGTSGPRGRMAERPGSHFRLTGPASSLTL